MPWTNLFDLGECTVQVFFGFAEVYSGVLGKGDQDTFEDSEMIQYTVAVSEDGAVSLDSDLSFPNSSVFVCVIPSYEHDYPARISGAAFHASVQRAGGFLSDDGDEIEYTSLDPVAPEPLDLSALPGSREYVAIFAEPGF